MGSPIDTREDRCSDRLEWVWDGPKTSSLGHPPAPVVTAEGFGRDRGGRVWVEVTTKVCRAAETEAHMNRKVDESGGDGGLGAGPAA